MIEIDSIGAIKSIFHAKSLVIIVNKIIEQLSPHWLEGSEVFELIVQIYETNNRSIPDLFSSSFSFENCLLCLCTGKIVSHAHVTTEASFREVCYCKATWLWLQSSEKILQIPEKILRSVEYARIDLFTIHNFTLDLHYSRISVSVMVKSTWFRLNEWRYILRDWHFWKATIALKGNAKRILSIS